MATKEERDRRRQERLEAERRELAAARRRLIFGYVAAGGLALAVVVGLVIVILSGGDGGETQVDGRDVPEEAHVQLATGGVHGLAFDDRPGTPPPPLKQGDLETAADEAGCELQLDLPDQGSEHIASEGEAPEYETDPPTSGDHGEETLADGAYAETAAPFNWLHSMEHGRIVIHYSPELPEEEQLELKGVFDESPEGVIFFPDPDMPYEVAATAWTQLIGCKDYEGTTTIDAIRDFRDIYRGQGPEAVPLVAPG